VALGVAHLLNDVIQSMIPAIYRLIKDTYRLKFARIGVITLAFQVTSSLLQPLLGHLTDSAMALRDGGRNELDVTRSPWPLVRDRL